MRDIVGHPLTHYRATIEDLVKKIEISGEAPPRQEAAAIVARAEKAIAQIKEVYNFFIRRFRKENDFAPHKLFHMVFDGKDVANDDVKDVHVAIATAFQNEGVQKHDVEKHIALEVKKKSLHISGLFTEYRDDIPWWKEASTVMQAIKKTRYRITLQDDATYEDIPIRFLKYLKKQPETAIDYFGDVSYYTRYGFKPHGDFGDDREFFSKQLFLFYQEHRQEFQGYMDAIKEAQELPANVLGQSSTDDGAIVRTLF